MILIGESILNSLKAASYPVPMTVRDFYAPEAPVIPMITLDELPSNDGVYLDNQPAVVTNILTLEVYAKAKSVGGVALSAKALALQLMKIADDLLNQTYGITMTGQIAIAPYSDPSVCRIVARYEAYIDTRLEQDNILRRV